MKAHSPFSHRPDRELGEALARLLGPDSRADFTRRVMDEAAVALGHPSSTSWDVLGRWFVPGVAAAMLIIAIGVAGLVGARSSIDTAIGLEDASQVTPDESALLLSPDPPSVDIVLASTLEY